MVKEVKLRSGEIFKPHGYEVSDLGRVRSYRNRYSGYGKKKFVKTPKIINGRPDQSGYTLYMLYDKNGYRKNVRGHVIVMQTFVGFPKNNMQVCHYDDIKTNNKLSNLRYGTAKENGKDRIRNKLTKI